MQLRIQIRSGGEVKWAGHAQDVTVFYGGPPPETGLWKLSIPRLEDYLCAALNGASYGASIDIFVLGFEIGELDGWGSFFSSMEQYTSYRPRTKLLLSVGQLNWPDVKDLSAGDQFERFAETLLQAVARVKTMKRKPRGFDIDRFSFKVAGLLRDCPVGSLTV
jgi:hypothetical protein